ncbi:hypothetical protein [Methylobacterium gnaphalii]|uniref:Uncharacterized protein n=1 Tax=Methylobacterium gnaphalii TaxID=1010610 RepID=A0A512JF79_9HYPH|nr:hypothetical protein [Methylobacterium gnaphalii]GEP08592.1 hypothetical protein MGN01_04370 [Methylobacterium gnaphalii]GJD70573.1 hypothetical protein MMMDOFMJ_3522 [Methylobacterium gnaphalii]GLS50809.1 hypothetical protein GCM10007885_36630 [Methylobacterium gnaphalii]
MDRERDRDSAEELIEEHDDKVGRSEPERERPGQDDAASRPVDGQKLQSEETRKPEPKPAPSSNPGPFAPH